MPDQAKTIVLGGSGFIGGHLLRALLADGYTNIIPVDRHESEHKGLGVEYCIGQGAKG